MKSYLKIFARMSQEIGQAHREKERADEWTAGMVLDETKDLPHKAVLQIREALACLQISRRVLEGGPRKQIGTLQHEMENHPGLPTLRIDRVEMTGQRLLCLGLADAGALERVSTSLWNGGFAGMLDYFDVRVGSIIELTRDMEKKVEMLNHATEQGEMRLVVKENRNGNLLVEFSRLTTAWLEFLQDFHALCILAAELWYELAGHGSLVAVQDRSEKTSLQ